MIYSEDIALQAVTLTGASPYAGPSRASRDERLGALSKMVPYVPAAIREKPKATLPASGATVATAFPEVTSDFPSIESFLVEESAMAQPADAGNDAEADFDAGDDAAEGFDAGDPWPFEDAGRATATLSDSVAARPSVLRSTDEPLTESALPMWSDDEMDGRSSVATERSPSEAAAQLFDSIASRFRSGELHIPENAIQLGEAPALAAALAALLGSRG